MNYRTEAVKCVNQYVLPEMKRQFEECGQSLDEQYKKYGNTEYFWLFIRMCGIDNRPKAA